VRAALDLAEQGRSALADLVDQPGSLISVLTGAQLRELRATQEQAHEVWAKLREQQVTVTSLLDADYPDSLRSLLGVQAPPLLFVRGSRSLMGKPSVGFCGSRKASEKGIAVAHECAEIVSRQGINIVSGYAAGVDMATHRAALEADGTTILILAEGIFHFRIKRDLKDVWDWERALVVSEYPPGVTWNVQNAMRRNATICALSKAMVLIEARETGGSMEAGRTCLKLGLPLFAPVYEGMPESARGNQILLGEGARSLFKSRSTDLPNLRAVLATLHEPPEPSQSPSRAEAASDRAQPLLFRPA
jgi:DNA processing protein